MYCHADIIKVWVTRVNIYIYKYNEVTIAVVDHLFRLNLTAANRVILMDIWWNPALEEQAIDRVHRIGQRLPVYVTRLMIDNTVEEKIIQLQEKKVR